MGMCSVLGGRWDLYSLATWRECEMALATDFLPQLSVGISLHCVIEWKTHIFRFVSVELYWGLFAPSLTCVYHHLEFVGIS